MASRLDVEMLLNQMNQLGESGLKRRQLAQQHESEMSRMALEQQMRDIQQSRYDAQQAHFNTMEESNSRRADAAEQHGNQPKIQAYIANPDDNTKGVLFQGSQEQLDALTQTASKKYGKPPDILPNAPGGTNRANRPAYATHTIGGSTYHFYSKADNDAFVKEMESHGMMTGGIAPAKETPSTMDERKTVEETDAKEAVPASPGVHHWFSADEPGTPGTPAQPKRTTTTISHIPAMDQPSLPAAVPTVPGALPTSAPLVPTGGGLPLPPPPTASSGPTKVQSQADYDALAPGTPYIDSAGNQAVKGGKKNTNQQ